MASKIIKYTANKIIRSGTGSRLPPMPTIRDIIKIYKLTAMKQMSQNFLMDEQLTARIVKAAGNIENHYVLEVGPGPGSITRSILRKWPKQLVVVEKDRRFVPTMNLLADAVQPNIKMDIYRDDILSFKINEAFTETERCEWDGPLPPVHLIGNLPFAISTRLLINWLKDVSLQRNAWYFGRTPMTLTFQKEVGERIVAKPMDEQRCRLSVMSQIWTRPVVRFIISGKAFVPKPDVDVAVVRLDPLRQPLTTLPFDLVEKVIREIFSMRQKYVRRGIANLYPDDYQIELTKETFDKADVNPTARSYQLSNEECIRLADAYKNIIERHPGIASYNYRACKKQTYDSVAATMPLTEEAAKMLSYDGDDDTVTHKEENDMWLSNDVDDDYTKY